MQAVTENKVREIVSDISGEDFRNVKLNSSLVSLDCEEIVEEIADAIQDEFDLDQIDDDVVEGWRTVGDICRYVLKYP
ncbi:acyl carrier protein [Pseudomonas aeruginosa]|uniref:acyl carrier protein n=1 Tax=Pseudomonas aeruginosa TaxID=287 RepID=UPI0032B4DED7